MSLRSRLFERIWNLASPLTRWMYSRSGPFPGKITLVHRRIFIVPSRSGLAFGVLLLIMLIGSINYSKSLGFVLTFLLASLALVSMLHTFRNLSGLVLRAGHANDAFAGKQARFTVLLDNPSDTNRYAVCLRYQQGSTHICDVPGSGTAALNFSTPVLQRGWFDPGRFCIFTEYPMGLFYAWSWADLTMRCLVYPAPETGMVPAPCSISDTGEGASNGVGQEDYAGLRKYHLGDSPRHVAWKAVARGQGMFTKQFAGASPTILMLDFESIEALDTEQRLSRLTRWVQDAEAMGVPYGLRLPGLEQEPGAGEAHRLDCLKALALFGLDS